MEGTNRLSLHSTRNTGDRHRKMKFCSAGTFLSSIYLFEPVRDKFHVLHIDVPKTNSKLSSSSERGKNQLHKEP